MKLRVDLLLSKSPGSSSIKYSPKALELTPAAQIDPGDYFGGELLLLQFRL